MLGSAGVHLSRCAPQRGTPLLHFTLSQECTILRAQCAARNHISMFFGATTYPRCLPLVAIPRRVGYTGIPGRMLFLDLCEYLVNRGSAYS